MAEMTDIMVDVETTDTNAAEGGIIQLAAIKFNYQTGEIGQAFDRCPTLMPFRRWSDGTRDFWFGKNRKVLNTIVARQEPYQQVFSDFFKFAAAPEVEGGLRFWAKPVQFDWSFIASHFEQLDLPMPFHYRYARDMNSFISGLRGDPQHFEMASIIPFEGSAHNALHDTAYQLDCLFAAKKGNFSEVLPS